MKEFEAIYRTYFTEVELYLRAICHDESLAEELTEQVFFKALKALPSFRGDCDIRTWLCAMGKNCYLSHLRKAKPTESIDELQIPDLSQTLEERLTDRDTAKIIHRCLHALPEPYKEVFSLRVFGELSFADIGGLFGRTPNWACVTYHRARQKIQEQMEGNVMKISCDIIRDLLPLYAENMTSPASNDLVDGHLRECEGCRTCLNDLRRPARQSEEISLRSLRHVKTSIQKRRILTALLAVLLLVSLYVNAWTILDTYVYLTPEQAGGNAVLEDDGRIFIYWKGHVSGIGSSIMDEAPNNMGIVCQTSLRQLWFPDNQSNSQPAILDKQETYFNHYGAEPAQFNIWYYNWQDGKPEVLLWDAGAEPPAADFTFEPVMNNATAWYCIATAILSLLTAVLACVKRKTGARKGLRMAALVLGCSCVAVLCTSGGQFVAVGYGIPSKILDSWLPFVPMFLTGLCAFALRDMKTRDC